MFLKATTKKEIPLNILPPDGQPGFFDFPKWIETDAEKAHRVYESIPIRISPEAQELVKLVFLTCAPQKELLIFKFLRLGYKVGGRVMSMLTDDTVNSLQKAVRQLTFESHKFKGFIRFSVVKVRGHTFSWEPESQVGGMSPFDETLVAIIEPKNFVLPLLADHFSNRFRNEMFMIYDKTHKTALIHPSRKVEMIRVDDLKLPEMGTFMCDD